MPNPTEWIDATNVRYEAVGIGTLVGENYVTGTAVILHSGSATVVLEAPTNEALRLSLMEALLELKAHTGPNLRGHVFEPHDGNYRCTGCHIIVDIETVPMMNFTCMPEEGDQYSREGHVWHRDPEARLGTVAWTCVVCAGEEPSAKCIPITPSNP